MIVFWFRRDLRLFDNAGLHHALRAGGPVLPLFIFDTAILDGLDDKKDKRVQFIHDAVMGMQHQLAAMGSSLCVCNGTPEACFAQLMEQHAITAVYTNHDYEPAAISKDERVRLLLLQQGVPLYTFKDQVIFEKNEVTKPDGTPYTVFTPYSRKWKEKLAGQHLQPYACDALYDNFYRQPPMPVPTLQDMGFMLAPHGVGPAVLDDTIASNYDKTRDYPAINGTTHLSVHLRFGTISIRQVGAWAHDLNATLLNELIWRDFYQMTLWHFPYVADGPFKREYSRIPWRNNEQEFGLWCAGQTGYPIVDAGMRQLNQTGYMHNRVRMITASFLAKSLLIDWRWGEAYFAEKLLDYDLAANNGGWQWAAGCGSDAAPYFRIFNPALQTQKFDPQLHYVRQWVPEYDTPHYPPPIVNHAEARERCLAAYKKGLGKG